MANPDPKALQETAAALRDQAKAARQIANDALERNDAALGIERNHATQQLEAAEQAVKTAEGTVKQERNDAIDFRAQATDDEKSALEKEQKGDAAGAEELREGVGRYQARADAATERGAQAERDLGDARVSLAERQRDNTAINQKISQMNLDSNQAEKQLDSMEDKARLFDEAGRKLELAATVDNPVDRATLELDAEKLLKNASGIDLKVDAIVKVTGQDLQLPATPAPLPTPPVADASSDTPTADSPTSDTDVAASGASQPLQDEFAVAAPADGDAASPAATQTDATQPDATTVVQSDTLVDTGLLDDPLGVGTAGAQPIDAAAGLDTSTPQSDVAVASIGPENNTDTFAPSPDPALDAPDPTSDANALTSDSLADVGTVAPVDDTFAGDASATDDVNA
jgi:hypothetical protein